MFTLYLTSASWKTIKVSTLITFMSVFVFSVVKITNMLRLYAWIPIECTVLIVILKLKTYLQFFKVINTVISCNSL
jgi:hypothetical protein